MATKNKNKSSVILPKHALRIVKSMLADKTGKDLSPRDLEIGEVILSSLNSRGIKPVDWVNNKDGIRDKTAHQKRIKKDRDKEKRILKGMGDRPPIESSELEKLQMKKLKGIGLREHGPGASAGAMEFGRGAGIGNILRDPSGMDPGPQPKSYLKRKDAKPKRVLGRSPGYPFRKDKQLKKVTSASPTGTVASVSPRGAVLKAPEVSSRTQTSKEKQLSPFGTAFSNARKEGKDVFTFKGKKYTTELASPPRKRKSPPPAPKRKPTQKVSKEDQSVKLEPWSGGGELTVRPPLKPLEGGVRYKKLPDWLGGGEIKIDSTFEEEKGDNVTHGKKGGQVKKGVKKIKAKARRRAALRGHRAELRGG